MPQLQEYKCPSCGGAIKFDSGLQMVKCSFCDTTFEMDTLRAYDDVLRNEPEDELKWERDDSKEWTDDELEGMNVYVCRSCGGEIVVDETTSATACPFCDNPVVIVGRFSGGLRPDYVIPFRLDKKAAIEGLNRHLEGKKLLPDIFKDKNHIDEIKGLYVPFWLFDAEANAHIRYRGTRTRLWQDRDYNYTETSFFLINRVGDAQFEKVPVDGSEKMDDALMESIEPYDVSQIVDFQTAYLSGYLANKYDVSEDVTVKRANERVRSSIEREFRATVSGFNTVTPEHSAIQIENGQARYALFPVWVLNTIWDNRKFTFVMNGQTGKFVGDLPVDRGKFWKYFLLTALFVGLGFYALFTLINYLNLF